MLTQFLVTDAGDAGPGTLRAAIQSAASGDQILFDLVAMGTDTISIASPLDINESLTIIGPGSDDLTIDANHNSRIFNINDSAAIQNVSISGMSLTKGNTVERGGAIFSNENLSLTDIVVTESIASAGGGIYIVANGEVDGPSVHVTFTDVSISGNSAIGDSITSARGGGIAADINTGGSLTILRATIIGNHADDGSFELDGGGGGIFVQNGGEPFVGGTDFGDFHLSESIISGNDTNHAGGGVYLSLFGGVNSSNNTIERNMFADNYAHGSGGGIFIVANVASSAAATAVKIMDTTLTGNTSYGIGPLPSDGPTGGGGIALLDFTQETGDFQIVNSTISGNRGRNGGGLLLWGRVKVRHSTIYDNTAGVFDEIGSAYTGGGGVMIAKVSTDDDGPIDDPSFDNVIIAGNHHLLTDDPFNNYPFQLHAPNIAISYIVLEGGPAPEGIPPWNPESGPLDDNDPFHIDDLGFSYTIIDDISGPFAEGVNFADADGFILATPLLESLNDYGGFELPDGTRILTHALVPDPNNPAINAGTPGLIEGQNGTPIYDERGVPHDRIVGDRIDIGAFEVGPFDDPSSADFNLDEHIDGIDFLAWQRGFGTPSGASKSDGDADTDGDVDSVDLTIWKLFFGEQISFAVPAAAQNVTPFSLRNLKFASDFSNDLSLTTYFSRRVGAPEEAATFPLKHACFEIEKYLATLLADSDANQQGFRHTRRSRLELTDAVFDTETAIDGLASALRFDHGEVLAPQNRGIRPSSSLSCCLPSGLVTW